MSYITWLLVTLCALGIRNGVIKMLDRGQTYRMARETGKRFVDKSRDWRRIGNCLSMLQNEVTRPAAISLLKREMAHAAMGVRAGRFKHTGVVFGLNSCVASDAKILLVAGITPGRIGNGKHAMSAKLEHAGMVLRRAYHVTLVAITLAMTSGTHESLNL